ncbi:MAG: AAA family ATPase [Bacteroidetes bacterium]|nr:AAA family ATPase [Bacteroidota bacterium]
MNHEEYKRPERPMPPITPVVKPSKSITMEQLQRQLLDVSAGQDSSSFAVRPAEKWIQIAARKAPVKQLFGELWHEGELCILFADTNIGKSILAVQIADSISRGVAIPGFGLEVKAQPVLYFDFEMTAKQFQMRYTATDGRMHPFSDDLLRAEMNAGATWLDKGFKNFEDYMDHEMDKMLKQTGIKVVIVDNITYLRTETEQAKDALPLMKKLKSLKDKNEVSLLVLAHTPKRDPSRPLTINDLQGSKHLANFADSVFALGKSHTDQRIRYIRQLKQRNTEEIYTADHIALCQIVKPDCFLMLEFLGYGVEQHHLRETGDKERRALIQSAKDLSANGNIQREIARQLGISVAAVNKYLKTD